MNKYVLLGILIFALLFTTYIVDLTDTYSTTSDVGVVITEPDDTDVVTIWTMAKTFFEILTFQINGFPAVLNILFFYPVTGMVAYIIIDIILAMIPF